MGYKSKSLPEDVASRFEEVQPEDCTVGEFVSELLDQYESESSTETRGDVATREDVEALRKRLDDFAAELPGRTAGELEARFQ